LPSPRGWGRVGVGGLLRPAALACRAASKAGSDSPHTPRPPTRSHSRRVSPSHSGTPLSWIGNIASLPSGCDFSLRLYRPAAAPGKHETKHSPRGENRLLGTLALLRRDHPTSRIRTLKKDSARNREQAA